MTPPPPCSGGPGLTIVLLLKQVKVLQGNDRDLTGTLINIDDADGIIKMDRNDQLKILPLGFLAKFVPASV